MEYDLTVGVPLFGSRVAPRCCYAGSMMVAGIKEGRVAATKVVSTGGLDEYRWLDLVLELEVGVLVCGGIDSGFAKVLSDFGIKVVSNVAGEAEEVLQVLARGELHSWYGYSQHRVEVPRTSLKAGSLAAVPGPAARDESSARCSRWRGLQPSQVFSGEGPGWLASVSLDPLCRMDELPAWLRERGLNRVGVCHCSYFADDLQRLKERLEPEFGLIPFACRADCRAGREPGTADGSAACDPIGLAGQVNADRHDLIVVMGMCLAFYHSFHGLSLAPTAVLLPGQEKPRAPAGEGSS